MSPAELLTITLYVPDATVRRLSAEGWLRRRLQDGTGDLDFLVPGWWEGAHTVRLGLASGTQRPASVAAGDDRGSVG
jgi:hypothetical protein